MHTVELKLTHATSILANELIDSNMQLMGLIHRFTKVKEQGYSWVHERMCASTHTTLTDRRGEIVLHPWIAAGAETR